MCTIITATINAEARLPALKRIFEDGYGLFLEIPDAAIMPQLPPGRMYLVHEGYCDCGTAMGRGATLIADPFTEGDLEKLRRKGWGEAKIERWVATKLADKEKKRVEQHGFESMEGWLAMVGSLLASPSVNVFGLMHHWYGGDPATATFEVKIAKPIPIEAARPEDLLSLPPDTLLEFTP